jgi:hypothetical protein
LRLKSRTYFLVYNVKLSESKTVLPAALPGEGAWVIERFMWFRGRFTYRFGV